jgi:O-antigen/teichoic acid export membrane protein
MAMLASAKEKAKALLRWSERYMKTDMVYLAKGGFWLTVGQIAATASGLVLVIGFANLVPKDVYGTYKLVLSLAGILAAFTLTGMGTAVTQAVARGADGVFWTAFWVELRWSALILLAALGGAIYYFANGNRVIAISLLIVGACAPIIESTSLYGDFLNGKKDFRMGAFYGIIRALVPTAVMLITILITQDIILIVLAYYV